MPTISFEFFPPRTPVAELRLEQSLGHLLELAPRFATVSYGAGGSTQDGTFQLVKRLCREHDLDCGPHLSCVGRTKRQLDEIAREYLSLDVKRVVALRGDRPEGYAPRASEYQTSWELVAALKKVANFEIVVGCYPEGHPDDASDEDRYSYVERKVDAGADFAISQFFFETKNFLDYREECARRRIRLPIRPGLMPIHDPRQVFGFAEKCGTVISSELRERFDGRTPEECFAIARDLVCEQTIRLAQEGIDHLHIYTLDRHELPTEICKALGHLVEIGQGAQAN